MWNLFWMVFIGAVFGFILVLESTRKDAEGGSIVTAILAFFAGLGE